MLRSVSRVLRVRVAPTAIARPIVAVKPVVCVPSCRLVHSSTAVRNESPNAVFDKAPIARSATSPKVTQLVNDILALNILETVDLVQQLQTALGPLGAQMLAMPSAAPVAAAPAASAAPAAPAAAAAPAPAEEKAIVNIKLDKVDPNKRLNVIKEVKTVTGLGLKESKEFLDALPKILKKDMKREEALKLVAKFKELGGDCSLE